MNHTKPTIVDIDKIHQMNPAHRHCHMHMHVSPKNSTYVGLYCKEHNHHLAWLNDDQILYLIELGISAI